MVLVTSNPARQLLALHYIGEVQPADLARAREDINLLMTGLKPGFNLLVDMSQMHSMGLDCVTEMGHNMEAVDQAGVGTVARVIPDPSKDIGMQILSLFHYKRPVHVVVCGSLAEALQTLAI